MKEVKNVERESPDDPVQAKIYRRERDWLLQHRGGGGIADKVRELVLKAEGE